MSNQHGFDFNTLEYCCGVSELGAFCRSSPYSNNTNSIDLTIPTTEIDAFIYETIFKQIKEDNYSGSQGQHLLIANVVDHIPREWRNYFVCSDNWTLVHEFKNVKTGNTIKHYQWMLELPAWNGDDEYEDEYEWL